MELYGGEIAIESEIGVVTAATLRFPTVRDAIRTGDASSAAMFRRPPGNSGARRKAG